MSVLEGCLHREVSILERCPFEGDVRLRDVSFLEGLGEESV